MSLKSHAKRSLVATGAVAFAALGVAAPADAAINKQLVYQCKFPIIAPGTISMDIQGPDIPSRWPIGEPTPEWAITAKATLNAPIPKAMSAIDGLASIEGKAQAKADLSLVRGGQTFNVAANVNMNVPKVPFTPTEDSTATLDVFASGSAPSQYQDDPATGQIVLRSIAMNMVARDASGKAMQLAPVTRDWDNKVWVDSDSNPDTFDVVCRLNPTTPGQTLDLASIEFFDPSTEPGDNEPPSAPGATTATPGNGKVSLSWGAASDSDGTVAKYFVYQNGTKVAEATGTSTEITGLTNGTAYSFQVSAVDDDAEEGAKNAAVSATPVAPVNQKPGTPPSAPRQAGDIGQTTAIIRWGAATDPDGTIKGYKIQIDDEVKNVNGDARSVTFTGLGAESEYEALVWAIDNNDAQSATPLTVTFTTGTADNVKPTTPGTPTGTATETSIALTWTASTDADGIKGYDVYQGGTKVKTVTTNAATIDGLKPGTAYKFKVVAIDTKDLAGDASAEATISTAADKTAPTNPTVTTANVTSSSVLVKWSGATDAGGVTGYDVYNGATKVASVGANVAEQSVTGLAASTAYTFKVVAKDAAGNASTGGTATATTLSGGGGSLIRYKYTLAGQTVIKTLSKGTLPITGGIAAELDPATGKIEADLTLNPTSGRLTALGFLPVTAKIGFAPSGKTVGTLLDGQLETTSKVRIKVQEVKLFGAIPLAGGNNCQTKSLSEIKLKNTQEFFNYLDGGPIAGTYAISDLNGCGLLNGLVSPLTAGGGNTLNLTLGNPAKW